MPTDRVAPGRAFDEDDDELAARILGTGALHSVREIEVDEEAEPAIWLPMHRSGSRYGGWYRVAARRHQPLGFRRP